MLTRIDILQGDKDARLEILAKQIDDTMSIEEMLETFEIEPQQLILILLKADFLDRSVLEELGFEVNT